MISVVIPAYNEVENVETLYLELKEVLENLGDYEIIFVDDGSTDGTYEKIKEIAQKDEKVILISLSRNFGQSSAMYAGITYARGDIIITLDADGQNDPRDIPILLKEMKEKNLDVVCGWRKKRKDKITRIIPSIIANKIISAVTGVDIHDMGCTLRAYKSEFLKPIALYGEMHRFLPALLYWRGAKIGEIEVNHRERKKGKSKYGFERIPKVIYDLVSIKFILSYLQRPIHFFGNIGLITLSIAFLCVIYLIYTKISKGVSMIQSPILLLSAMLVIIAVQFILIGIIAEIIVRNYYQNITPFSIREITKKDKEDKN